MTADEWLLMWPQGRPNIEDTDPCDGDAFTARDRWTRDFAQAYRVTDAQTTGGTR